MANKTFYKNTFLLVLVAIVLCAVAVGRVLWGVNNMSLDKKTNGLIMLIEFERIEGVLQWEKELDSRGLTALINVQANALKKYPDVFKRLANKGYEIAGSYDSAPFWDMPHNEQYKHMKESKEFIEKIIGKKVRIFGSRYFAYDENTLKAADALGIEYILGRGISDIEAAIYAPEEYNVKIISVSNVDVGEPMGRGSLCDYSLWARGAGATEFGKIVAENIAKKPDNMILVSHAYLGGTRLEWWDEYKKALSAEGVSWKKFDEWARAQETISLSNKDIPLNTEVKYATPNPEKPIEDYEPIPGIDPGESKIVLPSSSLICE